MATTKRTNVWETYNCIEDAVMDLAWKWSSISNGAPFPSNYKEVVNDALAELSGDQTIVLNELFNEHTSYVDISKKYNFTYSKTHSCFSHAIEKLNKAKYFGKLLSKSADEKEPEQKGMINLPNSDKLNEFYKMIYGYCKMQYIKKYPFDLTSDVPKDLKETILSMMDRDLTRDQQIIFNSIYVDELSNEDIKDEFGFDKYEINKELTNIFSIFDKCIERVVYGDTYGFEKWSKNHSEKVEYIKNKLSKYELKVTQYKQQLDEISKETYDGKCIDNCEIVDGAELASLNIENTIKNDNIQKVCNRDILTKFVLENCVLNSSCVVEFEVLLHKYNIWCSEHGLNAEESRLFAFSICIQYHLQKITNNKRKCLAGIKLKEEK